MHTGVSKGAVLLLVVALPDNFKHQRDLWFNPRVSGINRSKDPLRGHGLKGFDISKIQRFQGLRDADFQGSKV